MEINTIIFGATGMIGQGVLIECLEHPNVKSILSIGRKSCGKTNDKLKEIIHTDFLDYSSIENELSGYNACFFCLGVSAVGMKEQDYHVITHDYVVKIAEVLSKLNPNMTFCFISGAGTDETLKSRMMWARVKGKAENSLKKFSFKKVYLMRPAYIQPKKGIKSSYTMYKILGPFYPVWKLLFRKYVSNTTEVGQAMINAVLSSPDKQTLENKDLIELANK
ncbi:MAG: hypothetical protein K8R74_05115 [Bacteroidales bacterium]|nr:hypothetical protein [Bacteroidales bacterium]